MKANQSLHITIKQPGLSKSEPLRQIAVFPQIPSDIEKFTKYLSHIISKELQCEPSPSFQESLREEAIQAIRTSDILIIKREGSFLQITLNDNASTSQDS